MGFTRHDWIFEDTPPKGEKGGEGNVQIRFRFSVLETSDGISKERDQTQRDVVFAMRSRGLLWRSRMGGPSINHVPVSCLENQRTTSGSQVGYAGL